MHNYGHKQIASGATWEWKWECLSICRSTQTIQPLGKPAEIFGASPVNRNRKAVAAIAVAFPVAVADVALELHIA